MLREGYWNQSRGEEQNNAIDRCRELWNEMDAVDCERDNILRRYSALLEKKMTRKVCKRNHSNESKTMRDTESQMQRAPVHDPGASILLFWDRPRRAGIRRLTGREEKQSSAD